MRSSQCELSCGISSKTRLYTALARARGGHGSRFADLGSKVRQPGDFRFAGGMGQSRDHGVMTCRLPGRGGVLKSGSRRKFSPPTLRCAKIASTRNCAGPGVSAKCIDPRVTLIAHPCAISDCNAIIAIMASITIRNLGEATKRKLKIRAAQHGRSMEQEVREILESAVKNAPPKSGANLADSIHRRFARLGGVELEPFPRGPIREPGVE